MNHWQLIDQGMLLIQEFGCFFRKDLRECGIKLLQADWKNLVCAVRLFQSIPEPKSAKRMVCEIIYPCVAKFR